jgi:hypothetical protein
MPISPIGALPLKTHPMIETRLSMINIPSHMPFTYEGGLVTVYL